MIEPKFIAIHADPVWRDRSDFIIGIDLGPASEDPPGQATREQLWAREVSRGTFEICCIPFHPYDLPLGDIVETKEHSIVRRVVWGGHYTLRAFFPPQSGLQSEVERELRRHGALVEWASSRLVGIDVDGARLADVVANYLAGLETDGHLHWESGYTVDHN